MAVGGSGGTQSAADVSQVAAGAGLPVEDRAVLPGVAVGDEVGVQPLDGGGVGVPVGVRRGVEVPARDAEHGDPDRADQRGRVGAGAVAPALAGAARVVVVEVGGGPAVAGQVGGGLVEDE